MSRARGRDFWWALKTQGEWDVQDDPKACLCKAAVKRAYNELRAQNVAELSAFDAADRLYRIYHPEVTAREARFRIAEWLDEAE